MPVISRNRLLDPVHHQGLRIALSAFCTSPAQSLYVEAHEHIPGFSMSETCFELCSETEISTGKSTRMYRMRRASIVLTVERILLYCSDFTEILRHFTVIY